MLRNTVILSREQRELISIVPGKQRTLTKISRSSRKCLLRVALMLSTLATLCVCFGMAFSSCSSLNKYLQVRSRTAGYTHGSVSSTLSQTKHCKARQPHVLKWRAMCNRCTLRTPPWDHGSSVGSIVSAFCLVYIFTSKCISANTPWKCYSVEYFNPAEPTDLTTSVERACAFALSRS